MTVEEKLHSLGLALPLPSVPADVYRRTRRVGNLVYVAGHTPNIDSRLQPEYAGVVGRGITPELAKKGAQLSGLNILAALKAEVGSLDKVKGFVQILGYVRSLPILEDSPASSTARRNSLWRFMEKKALRRAWRSVRTNCPRGRASKSAQSPKWSPTEKARQNLETIRSHSTSLAGWVGRLRSFSRSEVRYDVCGTDVYRLPKQSRRHS